MTFDPGSFSTSPASGSPVYLPLLTPAAGATLNEILMMGNNKAIIATPSAPDSDQDGFTVADGTKAPPPPKS